MGNVYKNENKIILLQMIEIYKPDIIDLDWMHFQITKANILTLHHIRKACEGGIASIENGAILTKKAHRLLNMVETMDSVLYDAWNELFLLINEGKQPPCREYISEAKKLKDSTQKIIYKRR